MSQDCLPWSVGKYEFRVISVFLYIGLACNWLNIGVLVLVPEVKFSCDGGNYTSDCDELRNCSTVTYDHSQFEYTATERYGLICERSLYRSLTKTSYMVGYFFSAFISGMLSDRFGRRPVLLVTPLCGCLVNVLSIFVESIEAYIALRFALACFHMAFWTTALILSMEIVTKQQRYLVELLDNAIFDLGTAIVGAVSYVLGNYIHHHILCGSLYLSSVVLVYFYTCESPRWLAARNRTEECNAIIAKIADFNDKTTDKYEYLRHVARKSQNKSPFLDLVRTPLIRKRTAVLFILWLCVVLTSYGIFFNLDKFTSDVRLGLIIMGAIGVPFNFPVMIVVNKLGRQVSSFILWVLSALLLFAMAPLADDPSSPVLTTLAMVGTRTVAGAFAVLYLHTQELYPTVIRQTGLGSCSGMGRIAGMVAPLLSLLNAYWSPATVVTLGFVGSLASLLLPLLPDTTGIELAQTIEDGERFLHKHRYSLTLPSKNRKRHMSHMSQEVPLQVTSEATVSNGNHIKVGLDE